MQIRIRPASQADERFFSRMESETTWASLTDEERRRFTRRDIEESLEATHALLRARAGSQVMIAETEEGERAGLLWFGVNRNLITGEEEAWIYNVSVLSDFRGCGIGSLLLAEAERCARAEGFQVIGLMVSNHNPAQRLYSRHGYETTNLVMRKPLHRAPQEAPEEQS